MNNAGGPEKRGDNFTRDMAYEANRIIDESICGSRKKGEGSFIKGAIWFFLGALASFIITIIFT